jgi:hypothetical protein
VATVSTTSENIAWLITLEFLDEHLQLGNVLP